MFREFLAWIIEADKKFLIIGNINCITYKEVFPLIMQNKRRQSNRRNESMPLADEYGARAAT